MQISKMKTLNILLMVIINIILVTAETKKSIKLCDQNLTHINKLQCFCARSSRLASSQFIKSASCYLTRDNVEEDDAVWDTFADLQTVSRLSIDNSAGVSLKYIPTLAMKWFKSTARFDIKHGDVSQIKPHAFSTLTSVEELWLSDNKIDVLHKHSFSRLKHLRSISLDKNNIKEITRYVFEFLPSLEKLFFSINNITTIHYKAFEDLTNLKVLELDKNRINNLNGTAFIGLSSLQRLELGNNNLQILSGNIFEHLVNLEYLNVENNKIQRLAGNTFHGLTKLQYLSLANNELSTLNEKHVFKDLVSLTNFNLNGNKLHKLDATVMAPIISNFYEAVAVMNIENNNFSCDCHLEWLMNLMNVTKSTGLRDYINNVKCSPEDSVRETWKKLNEMEEKATESTGNTMTDYDYYDEGQLNGMLFYSDVSNILNCAKFTDNKKKKDTVVNTIPKVENKGTLDLSLSEEMITEEADVQNLEASKPSINTLKTVNVSEKSLSAKKTYENEMHSDEAVENKTNFHKKYHKEESSKIKNHSTKVIVSESLLLTLTVVLSFTYMC